MKQFGNPPLSKRTPLLLSNFFMTPLCPNFKIKNPPPPNFRRGGGDYDGRGPMKTIILGHTLEDLMENIWKLNE